MAIKPETLTDLERAVEASLQAADNIKKRIEGLQTEYDEQMAEYRTLRAALISLSPKTPNKTSNKPGPKQNFKDWKFRNIVREFMKTVRDPIRPVELSGLMESAGVKAPGKSEMATRVAVELNKLEKAGEITKFEGRYAPKR